ncbi:MAG: hypothetical protein MZU97_04845 [Bacillus subtilis]|nr:hypothetical protein [Bacillus subtilis]
MKIAKSLFQQFSIVLTIGLLLMVPLVVRIQGLFAVDIKFVTVVPGLVFVAMLVTVALRIFQSDRIPTVIRIFVGYLVLFISTIVVRRVFGIWMFRRTVVVVFLVALVMILYSIAIYVVRKNRLWNKSK